MTKLKVLLLEFLQFAVSATLVMLCAMAIPSQATAQPVLNAESTALGGGGTAYISGFEAAFWNPANLAINDRRGTVHLGLGQVGILYEPVLSTDDAGDQFFNFTDSYFPYKPGAAEIGLTQRNSILEKNYPGSRLLSQHQTRTDLVLGGISWQRGESAFAIAARARFGSRIEVGRGWYSDDFISSGDREVRDLTLNQQINQLYEFSVGYAREFTFIEGLLPRISKLYIGFAPKIVLSGPSFDATYNARYLKGAEGNSDVYATEFFYRTTGEYSEMTRDYFASSNPQSAIDRNLSREFNFQNTGIGLGFDFGLTYMMPLGSDISVLEEDPEQSVVSKSLRFSFSVNDLGLVRYTQESLELSSTKDTVQIAQEEPKDFMFIGPGGQYLAYFDNNSAISNPILNSGNPSDNNFAALLPTSLNAGVLLDLNRLKFMGDLTLGLNNTAFTSTKLAIHLGLEVRPFRILPIRMGARLASGLPTHLGLGTGIETRYLDFNMGTQVILRSRTFTSELVGGAFAGIQLHL